MATRTMTAEETQMVNMAIGRLFRIMSRPYQEGDEEQYEKCKDVITAIAGSGGTDYAPNYARDYRKGI